VAGHQPHPQCPAPREPLAGSLHPPAPREPPARPLWPPATLQPSATGPHCSKPQERPPVSSGGRSAMQTKTTIKYIK
jgi:hypothetical protein